MCLSQSQWWEDKRQEYALDTPPCHFFYAIDLIFIPTFLCFCLCKLHLMILSCFCTQCFCMWKRFWILTKLIPLCYNVGMYLVMLTKVYSYLLWEKAILCGHSVHFNSINTMQGQHSPVIAEGYYSPDGATLHFGCDHAFVFTEGGQPFSHMR